MDYGGLIRDAFWITWRNKFLWFFGFFTAGGSASSFNFNFNGGNLNRNDFNFDQSSAGFPFLMQLGTHSLWILLIVLLVLIAIIIVLVFIALALISQGGLTDSVAAIDRGEGRRFGSTWEAGTANVWRVLGYFLLFILISIAILLVIGLPATLAIVGTLAATDSTGTRILVIVLVAFAALAALILIFIPLSIVGQYALRELVIRGERVTRSIGSGFRMFRRNLGRSLLLWLIQLGVRIGAGIVLFIVTLLVGLVLFLPTIVLAVSGHTTAAIVAGIVAGIILVPILIVISAALGTFNHSYWTLAYLRMTGEGTAEPRVR